MVLSAFTNWFFNLIMMNMVEVVNSDWLHKHELSNLWPFGSDEKFTGIKQFYQLSTVVVSCLTAIPVYWYLSPNQKWSQN